MSIRFLIYYRVDDSATCRAPEQVSPIRIEGAGAVIINGETGYIVARQQRVAQVEGRGGTVVYASTAAAVGIGVRIRAVEDDTGVIDIGISTLIIDAAAIVIGVILADGAIPDSQAAIIPQAASNFEGVIESEHGVAHGQRTGIGDPPTESIDSREVPVANGYARDCCGPVEMHLKNTVELVAVDDGRIGAGAE